MLTSGVPIGKFEANAGVSEMQGNVVEGLRRTPDLINNICSAVQPTKL